MSAREIQGLAGHKPIRTLDEQCARVYREHPFHETPDLAQMLRRLLEDPALRRATDLS